ncbi:DUF4192 domain-containing protein [Paeniglutamicibacter sp. ABSL32-1]|uniref:DUF4192 domain-containing protein n=1 Tax=Paeniglutamicibacter quisquiliarum TaxID=2849498 RepID=UPI001C2DCEF0|nr:DUF4192 domain-containing protein [Paeniglutamicibacter quisquiliarum]MBV1780335.1 DUF4192 domain-containing protein [Paeniglutamicibacter quisquiliarum]
MTTTPSASNFSLASPEEVLAYIPHALGFYPRNAVVLLIMQGSCLAATLRVDLPRTECSSATAAQWAEQLVQLVHKVPDATAVFAAVYTGQVPGGSHDSLPKHELVERLAPELVHSGIQVRDAWYVGANRWHSYFCLSENCCPSEGFDLPDLALTETHLRMVVAGSAPEEQIWDGGGVAEWGNKSAVRMNQEILARELSGSVPRESLVKDWAGLLDADPAVAERRLRADDVLCASLLLSLSDRMIRDILPYLAGRGTLRAFEALKEVSRASDFGRASQDFSDFLLGTAPCTPDWDRIERLWFLCRDLLGVAEGEEACALLCLLGWVNWAKGKGSSALRLFGSALKNDPEYRLAQLMGKLVESGEMPSWVADPARAWRLRLEGRLSA